MLHGPPGVAYEGKPVSLERRLQRVEYQHIRQYVATEAARADISVEVLWAECRRVLCTLSDANQRQYFQRLYGELTDAETVELDTLRSRWGTILRGTQ
jgi:hypothetical protein